MRTRLSLILFTCLLAATYTQAQISPPHATLCTGDTMTLTDLTTSGVWSSHSTAIATVGSASGLVRGVSAGAVVISYAAGASVSTITLTINPTPTISGPRNLCVGDLLVGLVDTVASGAWSSSDSSIVNILYVDTFMTAGTPPYLSIAFTQALTVGGPVYLRYITRAGCSVTDTFTVLPALPPIMGTSTLCVGDSITLSDSSAGGWWTTGGAGTVDSLTGVLTGTYADSVYVYYVAGNGCVKERTLDVLAPPDPGAILGIDSVCMGDSTTLYNAAAAGLWSSSNPAVATISGTGTVTGLLAGATIISFTVTNTCGTRDTTLSMSVGDCEAGVKTISAYTQPELEPNPNQGVFIFNLHSGIDEQVQLVIRSVLGQKVMELATTTNKSTSIHIPAAAGVYLLSAYTTHGRCDSRVIVR